MDNSNPLRVQDFLLSITSQNSILTLEAEHQPTQKVFTIDLDSDSIGQVTNGLFDCVFGMVQGLKDAADDSFKNLTLKISPQGNLTCTAMLVVGVIPKEFRFTLNLKEKNMAQVEILSRGLNSVKGELEKWKTTQENQVEEFKAKSTERSDRLEITMNQMDQTKVSVETFQAFETRIQQQIDRLENIMIQTEQNFAQRLNRFEELVKKSISFKPIICFNNASVDVSHFKLADNDKTAEIISSGGQCLEILPKIPSSEQYSYSIRINNTVNSWICFGITTKTGNVNWNWNNNQLFNYQYWISNGHIYGRANHQPTGSGPFGDNDQVLKMVVDMTQGNLAFLVEGKRVNSCSISKTDQYWAFVGFGHASDSVTLL